MSRSIFGWDYPPGCNSVPGDDPDPPCECCGGDPADCACLECPVCEESGNTNCYIDHGLELRPEQIKGLQALLDHEYSEGHYWKNYFEPEPESILPGCCDGCEVSANGRGCPDCTIILEYRARVGLK